MKAHGYFIEGQLEALQNEAIRTGLCRNCGNRLDSGSVHGFLGRNKTAIECEVCTPLKLNNFSACSGLAPQPENEGEK